MRAPAPPAPITYATQPAPAEVTWIVQSAGFRCQNCSMPKDDGAPVPGTAASEPTPLNPAAPATEEQVELFREATTMAVYVSLSLLAVLAALPLEARHTRVITVGLTGVGLLLAHWLASKITSNFALSQLKTAEGLKMLSAQVAGGLAVTIVAVIPLLLFPTVSGVWASAGLLVAFVCAVSYYAARANQRSRPAAFAYVLAIVVIATGIVILKTAVEH